jgi:FkbM family methyltransferase
MKQNFLNFLRKFPKPINRLLSVLHFITKKINLFSARLNLNTLQRPEVKRWDAAHGDATLRLDYLLNENSVVFDVGGFSGEWAAPIFLRYMPHLYIFEPVKESIKALKTKFGNNPKVRICEFGLSGKNEMARISSGSHSASTIVNHGGISEEIKLVKMSDFVKEKGISRIDLIKLNIEGGEYHLLDHIIESGLVKNIDNIQVQFHDFFPEAEARMRKIQDELRKTHHLTYEFPFVWENWKRNI